jgi:hypothetical protein
LIDLLAPAIEHSREHAAVLQRTREDEAWTPSFEQVPQYYKPANS